MQCASQRNAQVHDENLQSIQLLNQFMDERSASSAWSALRGGSSSSNNNRKVRLVHPSRLHLLSEQRIL